MVHTIKNKDELYIFLRGKLIHKTRIDNSQSGVTFDVMAYRRNDSLCSLVFNGEKRGNGNQKLTNKL